jgi:hypothetical protein
MHRRLVFLGLVFISSLSFSQTDSVEALFAFRITDYMVKLNDSVTVVQVALPEASPVSIKNGQVGILKHRYENNSLYDTAIIGWGRCHLIKSNYYYFAIHKYHDDEPKQGNLLYTKCKAPLIYNGLLFNISRHAISLTKVDESQFYYNIAVFSDITKEKEWEILDSMAADIQYTGKVMLEQSPQTDQFIKGGIYDGKKLFAAMQEVKRNDVIAFLKYMIARPAKYAGNVWKLSEVYATWMVNESPTVIEN